MTRELTENYDTEQEPLLREVMREHAPAHIDVEEAWAAVAPRLALAQAPFDTHRDASRAGISPMIPAMKQLLHRQRVLVIAAAAMVIVLLLAGAAFGTPYWGGIFGGDKAKLIGDERLYTTINQSQTVSEVTITIDKVYADPGNIYIALTVRLPRSLAGKYNHTVVNKVTIANANGQQPGGMNVVCDPLSDDSTVAHCLFDTGPLRPDTDASHLTLTVDIGEVWLLRPNVHDPDVRSGPWHFTFTVPFHQQNPGFGGPYAQPTPSQNP